MQPRQSRLQDGAIVDSRVGSGQRDDVDREVTPATFVAIGEAKTGDCLLLVGAFVQCNLLENIGIDSMSILGCVMQCGENVPKLDAIRHHGGAVATYEKAWTL